MTKDSFFERLRAGRTRLVTDPRGAARDGLAKLLRGAAALGQLPPLPALRSKVGWVREQLHHARVLMQHEEERQRFVYALRQAVAKVKDPQEVAAAVARDRALLDEIRRFRVLPLISILVPVYNTPRAYLEPCIESVLGQLYPAWELCLADDGSSSVETKEVLSRYAARDARIRIVSRPGGGNRGISDASNLALACVQGEFLALLDHDDELTPDALYQVAALLNRRPDLDYIYSDEDKRDRRGALCQPFHKPDWSPELLFNCMYTGHLSVYRTSLVRSVGGFRSEFDFSQDYDLALRVTERTDKIEHIPRILYHWRQAEGSAAAGGKDYARDSNIRALQSALDRRGIDAVAEALPAANRVRMRRRTPVRVSLIIPTDSEQNLGDCLDAIFAKTSYPDLEIVVVTNSALADTMRGRYPDRRELVLCRFDKPFNFSLKCNEGAVLASGEIVVFFNDDVRPLDSGWVEDLIELLALPEIGAVSPKLLYEDHTVQHAGLVTGVRGLVGTAFHCLPAASGDYFNFALSVRDASAISGACLAMRKRDFIALDGFDSENVPINHSDVDLCFRVRERGLRCVYTPHTTLLHIGHLSLRDFEQEEKKAKKKAKDKSDVFLLKRWAGFTGTDPYYTEPMRNLLYRDSPAPWRLSGANSQRRSAAGRDTLFISHQLSESGAPLVLYYAVERFVQTGGFAVVLSPEDGPFRARFEELGVPVIVDSVAFTQPEALGKLVAGFDLVVANTIDSWPLVHQAEQAGVPALWYLHEGRHLLYWVRKEKVCRQTLERARNLWVGSTHALRLCRGFNPHTRIMTYGIPDILDAVPKEDREPIPRAQPGRLVFSTFASFELRKGQDLLVRAIKALPAHCRDKAVWNLIGRPLDESMYRRVVQDAAGLPCIRLREGVDLAEYRRLLLASDVIVCPSRDDTLPLVTLDALAAGKVLLCTDTTGTSEFLHDGADGLVVKNEDVAMLGEHMRALIEDPSRLGPIGESARALFRRHFSLAAFHQRFDAAVEEALRGAPVAQREPRLPEQRQHAR